jgi:uncharacterized protein
MKKTLVIGASTKPERYAYKAIRSLVAHGHEVIGIGMRAGEVDGVHFDQSRPLDKDVDSVTLYLNAGMQEHYYDYILALKPKRVIFNPGTENDFFVQKLGQAGIATVTACTLVLLSTGQY